MFSNPQRLVGRHAATRALFGRSGWLNPDEVCASRSHLYPSMVVNVRHAADAVFLLFPEESSIDLIPILLTKGSCGFEQPAGLPQVNCPGQALR